MVRRQTTVKSSIERTVEVKYELAKQGDYLNLLGIDRDDSQDRIRQAYLRWVKMVHPDNLARNSITHLREKAALVFKVLSTAYEIFSDEDKKRAYLAIIDNGEGADTENGERRTHNEEEEAKIALHQARLLLRRRSWTDAEELLRKFVETYPSDAQALTLLGWCILQNEATPEKKRLKEARSFWETAIKADEENADAHYHLSLYFKLTGNLTQQEKSLKLAVEHDETHVAARREIRLLGMRKDKAENTPETLGDFCKRVWAKLNKKKGEDGEDGDDKDKKKGEKKNKGKKGQETRRRKPTQKPRKKLSTKR